MPAGKIYLIEMRLHHALNPKPNYPTYIPKNYSQNLHLFGNNSNDNMEKKGSLKVYKSQKHFFLKLHCPKNERNIRQNSAL